MSKARELNWINPKVAFKTSPLNGTGAFALEPISKGETLVIFGGYIIPINEYEELPERLKPYNYQISHTLLFGPATEEQITSGECWNHSCEPNAGFRSEASLIAIRSIKPGEEITFDYATCMSTAIVNMPCDCGSEKCRGNVDADDWKLLPLQIRYRHHFQPYLREEIGFGLTWWLRAALYYVLKPFISDGRVRGKHHVSIQLNKSDYIAKPASGAK